MEPSGSVGSIFDFKLPSLSVYIDARACILLPPFDIFAPWLKFTCPPMPLPAIPHAHGMNKIEDYSNKHNLRPTTNNIT
jgi:hypothetical protein